MDRWDARNNSLEYFIGKWIEMDGRDENHSSYENVASNT